TLSRRILSRRAQVATLLTEADWLHAADPELMLTHLRALSGISPRKLRLWGCACVRRVWDRLTDENSRVSVAISEAFAHGMVSTQELAIEFEKASTASVISDGPDLIEEDDDDGMTHCSFTIVYDSPARAAAETASTDVNDVALVLGSLRIDDTEEAKAQATLLRHIVGNPWRPLVS